MAVPSQAPLQIGQRVVLIGKDTKGTVRYFGEPKFAPGKWVGVELDEATVKSQLFSEVILDRAKTMDLCRARFTFRAHQTTACLSSRHRSP